MKKEIKIKSKVRKKPKIKSSATSALKERFNKVRVIKRQKPFETDEFENEFGLYSFDSGLKKKYQKLYKGKKLDKHFGGTVIKNRFGTCYSITENIGVKIIYSTKELAKQKLGAELRVVDGIGEVYAQKLQQDGYKSINDLSKHHRFAQPAEEFIGLLSQNKGIELFNWLERRLPKSHPSVFIS